MKNEDLIFFITGLVLFIFNQGYGKNLKVASVQEYNRISGSIQTGDTIVWESGNYADFNWVIGGNHLTIKAREPGKVVFGGSTTVKITGDHNHFSGFQFRTGKTDGNVIEVSGSYNNVSDINIYRYASHYYFHITPKGKHNVVTRCNFEDKPPASRGKEGSSIFQVAVDSISPGYNIIRYCSFKNHTAPPSSGGDYGMEALRIGYSYQRKFISRTLVEFCFFTRCNGDGEIISNKARENVFRYNTFSGNGDSHFTLRHGSNNVVYGNYFLNGAGIRIKEGQNQMVYNNYFSTSDFFSIRLENYKADPLSNIIIAHNTFYKSGPLKLGGKGEYQPAGVVIAENLFVMPFGALAEDLTGNEHFAGNVAGIDTPVSLKGFSLAELAAESSGCGFYQPASKIVGKDSRKGKYTLIDIPELDDDPRLKLDIAGNRRPSGSKSAGCFEPSEGARMMLQPATEQNTGPQYLSGNH